MRSLSRRWFESQRFLLEKKKKNDIVHPYQQ